MLLFIKPGNSEGENGTNSNTSHVIVYPAAGPTGPGSILIQIHLMLLFIAVVDRLRADPVNSNTSHVIVYQVYTSRNGSAKQNSNTSHVIVYPIRKILEAFRGSYSNTSHVIVYLTFLRLF